jgi:hypothetical protein
MSSTIPTDLHDLLISLNGKGYKSYKTLQEKISSILLLHSVLNIYREIRSRPLHGYPYQPSYLKSAFHLPSTTLQLKNLHWKIIF